MSDPGHPTTVTVLFTDLVGSTALRMRLGEETAEALRRVHDQLLVTAVETHRGRVVKGTGDGVLATFAAAATARELGTGDVLDVVAHLLL